MHVYIYIYIGISIYIYRLYIYICKYIITIYITTYAYTDTNNLQVQLIIPVVWDDFSGRMDVTSHNNLCVWKKIRTPKLTFMDRLAWTLNGPTKLKNRYIMGSQTLVSWIGDPSRKSERCKLLWVPSQK